MSSLPAPDPRSILVALFSVAHTPEQAEHAAKTVLNQHARYLANRQRQATPHGRCSCGLDLCASCDTHRLIDLIDPEAS